MGEMFHVVKMTRDNLTVTKVSEDYFYFNFPKKDGYSRIVMDIKVENASSNGYGVTYFKYIPYLARNAFMLAISACGGIRLLYLPLYAFSQFPFSTSR